MTLRPLNVENIGFKKTTQIICVNYIGGVVAEWDKRVKHDGCWFDPTRENLLLLFFTSTLCVKL